MQDGGSRLREDVLRPWDAVWGDVSPRAMVLPLSVSGLVVLVGPETRHRQSEEHEDPQHLPYRVGLLEFAAHCSHFLSVIPSGEGTTRRAPPPSLADTASL